MHAGVQQVNALYYRTLQGRMRAFTSSESFSGRGRRKMLGRLGL